MPEIESSDQPRNERPAEPSPAGSRAEMLMNSLLYGLSLPERLARSAVGVTAGTAKEIAEFVVPQAFQDSKSYEVMIRNSLSFLLSSVGTVSEDAPTVVSMTALAEPHAGGAEMPSAADPSIGSPGRFIARKAVGNFIDIAGLATLHVSPLWILAIVSDAAYGTKTYVRELAEELQKQGLIDDSSTIHKVEDLFGAVREASGKAASNFDQPPLSLEELRTSFEQTRKALNGVDPTQLIPEAEISRLWNGMREMAQREDVSLLGVSGAVAMQTLESIKGVSHGTLTGLFVAGKIVNRNIFGHYIQSMNTIRETGLWTSVKETYEPYLDTAWGNFTSSRRTWTEQVFNPGHLATAWNAITGWLGKGKNRPHAADSTAMERSPVEGSPGCTHPETNDQ